MKIKVREKPQSVLQLLKTIKTWSEEVKEMRKEAMNNEHYNHANYLCGKMQAYDDVIELLQTINTNKIPFDLK